mmetsp:Transcript_32567/g.87441  ORF Transcript_32567/g.87441 Transcript_32567/m.87441 type:complete len:200 (-) Transcript_32567:157-756(-)
MWIRFARSSMLWRPTCPPRVRWAKFPLTVDASVCPRSTSGLAKSRGPLCRSEVCVLRALTNAEGRSTALGMSSAESACHSTDPGPRERSWVCEKRTLVWESRDLAEATVALLAVLSLLALSAVRASSSRCCTRASIWRLCWSRAWHCFFQIRSNSSNNRSSSKIHLIMTSVSLSTDHGPLGDELGGPSASSTTEESCRI